MFFYRTKLWNRDSGFYSCVVTKLMNSSSYSITAYSISCNTDSYYSVITITAYQTSPKPFRTHLYKQYMVFPYFDILNF